MTIQLKAVDSTSFPWYCSPTVQGVMTFEAEDKIFKCGEMKAIEQ